MRTVEARPVHSNGCWGDSEPLTIAVILLGDWIGTVVGVEDVRQCLNAKLTAVVFVGWP